MRNWAVAALLLCGTAASAHPEIAITIDDLPEHSPYPPGETPQTVARTMIAALTQARVPVHGFVNGRWTEQQPDTIDVLRAWHAAGLPLGNHGWAHRHLSEMSVAGFEQELARNEPVLTAVGGKSDWHWFRYPFLDEGKDAAQRLAARQVLARHGYRVAAVTTSFSDWAFTDAYARCGKARDEAAMARLQDLYLAALRDSIAIERENSRQLYGRDIPLVLLIHISALSARMMSQVIAEYRKAGFRFVSLSQAESDPAYRGDVDLASPPPLGDYEVAKRKGVTLRNAIDLVPQLNAICRP